MRTRFFGPVVAIAAALGACAGTQQISYDREFSQLNELRSAARLRLDDPSAHAAERGLETLSRQAEAAAVKARGDGRKLDAIALYRVAASAAWKSGNGRAVTLAGDGLTVCSSIPPTEQGAPRDCLFLEMVGPSAIIDERGSLIRNFQLRIVEIIASRDAEARKVAADRTMSAALEILEYTKKLNGIRARIASSEVSAVLAPEMLLYANEQVRRGFCHAVIAAAALNFAPFVSQRNRVDGALAEGTLRAEIGQRRNASSGEQRVICADFFQPRNPSTTSRDATSIAARNVFDR